jgi:hypothetical protein
MAKNGMAKNGMFRLPSGIVAQTEPAVAAHRGDRQLRRPGLPRETDCMPEDAVHVELAANSDFLHERTPLEDTDAPTIPDQVRGRA